MYMFLKSVLGFLFYSFLRSITAKNKAQEQENIPEPTNKMEGFKKRMIPGSPDTIKAIPNNEKIMRNRKNQAIILLTVLMARLFLSIMPCTPLQNGT